MRSCYLPAALAVAAGLGAQGGEPPAPPVVVRGQVLDADGRPLPGAAITVEDVETPPADGDSASPRARTGADGRFEMTWTPAARAPTVWKAVVIAARGMATLVTPRPGRFPVGVPTPTLDLGRVRLAPGTTLKGRVRGPRGLPIAGARVRAEDLLTLSPYAVGHFEARTVTDGDGAFELSGACRSAMRLVVDAPGHYRRTIAPINAGDPLDVTLEPGGFCRGTLLDAEGEPTRGHVIVTYEVLGAFQQIVATNEEGQFEATVRYPCRYRVFAYDESNAFAQSDVLPGPADNVTLRSGDSVESWLAVRVFDAAEKKPIGGARAAAFWHDGWTAQMARSQFSWGARRSDGTGVVRVGGPAAFESPMGIVRAAAAGYAPATIEKVRWRKGKKNAVEVHLGPESTIEGVVVSASDGAPLGGAELALFFEDGPSFGGRPSWWNAVAGDRVDDKGAFRFDGLEEGKYRVVARHQSGWAEGTAVVELGAAEHRRGVTIRIDASASLSGVIDGLPKGAGAQIVLRPVQARRFPSPMGPVPEGVSHAVAVGADGRFALRASVPGAHDVELLLGTPARTGAVLRVPAGRQVLAGATAVKLAAGPHRPGTLRGKIHASAVWIPPGRLAVLARRRDEHRKGGGWVDYAERLQWCRWAEVGRDQSFELQLAPGEHRLQLVDLLTGVTLYESAEKLRVTAGDTVQVVLEPALVEVRLTLEPAAGHLVIADRVTIRGAYFSELQQRRDHVWVLGISGHGNPGLSLGEGRREHVFYVPAGAVELDVLPGASRLHMAGTHWSFERSLGKAVFEAEEGEPMRVTIEVSPPKSIER